MGDQTTDNDQGSSPNATGQTAKPVRNDRASLFEGSNPGSCDGQDPKNYHGNYKY